MARCQKCNFTKTFFDLFDFTSFFAGTYHNRFKKYIFFRRPPSHDNSRVMHTFIPDDYEKIEFGTKSDAGTGGMESKVKSGLWALDNSCSVVICNGMRYNSIRKIMKGEKVGTFFSKTMTGGVPTEILAKNGKYVYN